MAKAAERIGSRDPDDIELLALDLHLGIPIWTNDRDFEAVNVDVFTTESLLRHLGLIR
jgi:predicted nucleic acid-binding protein